MADPIRRGRDSLSRVPGANQLPLTQMAHGSGCGCKIGPGVLANALASMPGLPVDPDILVGHDRMDDAAVYRLSGDAAVVATVDFFTPIVDDPATFGAIAATNALSDVYAMGAKPLFALAVAAYPRDGDLAVLGEILRGGAEVAGSAGCPVLGGHTIDDAEPKYGLAVVGTVHPGHVMTNAAGRPGDVLVLTKALGTGIVVAAAKADGPGPVHALAVEQMLRSNAAAAEAAREVGIRCATDVTGFGLLGHAHEMAERSGVRIVLEAASWPALDGALEVARAREKTGGDPRNRDFAAAHVTADGIPDELLVLGYDPQTAGGLLVSLAADQGAALVAELGARDLFVRRIGHVEEGAGVAVA